MAAEWAQGSRSRAFLWRLGGGDGGHSSFKMGVWAQILITDMEATLESWLDGKLLVISVSSGVGPEHSLGGSH